MNDSTFFKLTLLLSILTSFHASAQNILYAKPNVLFSKKVEVFNEHGYTKLLNRTGDRGVATFNHNQHTSTVYDVENVKGGVLIRNKWTINFYDDNLEKVREFRIFRHVKSHALGKTFMRKEGDNIYVIRILGPTTRLDEFRNIQVLIFPIKGKDEEIEEIEFEIPHYLLMNSFDCEVVDNKLLGIAKKPEMDKHYFFSIDLKSKFVGYDKLNLPSTNPLTMSLAAYKDWSHLFHNKDHFWLYEFYTTDMRKKVRKIVAHIVEVDMEGSVIQEHTFNLSSLSSEMLDHYTFAPGITFDEQNEKVFIIGPSTGLNEDEDDAGFLYFLSCDLRSGAIKRSTLLNASDMIEYIPEDYKFKGLKTITSKDDPTQLTESVPKLRPLFYDPLNNSLLIDYFYGNTGFGTKLEINFKKLRLIIDENGGLYRFGIIDDYDTHFLHGRHIKFLEPDGFKSEFWGIVDDPRVLNYKVSGYDLLTEELNYKFAKNPRILGHVIHKEGFDILVIFEEENFRTTLYKP